MKKAIVILTVILTLIAVPLAASEVGRYQVTTMDTDSSGLAAFIIDTMEGHCWWWAATDGVQIIIYVGKVRPGKNPGDVIEQILPKQPGTKIE